MQVQQFTNDLIAYKGNPNFRNQDIAILADESDGFQLLDICYKMDLLYYLKTTKM